MSVVCGHDAKTAAAEKFLLTTLPTAVGAVLRLPCTLAVARFGGRNWTCVSAGLLLVPALAAAVVFNLGVFRDAGRAGVPAATIGQIGAALAPLRAEIVTAGAELGTG